LAAVIVASAVISLAPAARAQEAPAAESAPADDAWQYSLTIPLWISSLDSIVEVRGVEASSHVSFADTLEDLELGLLAAGEARKGKLALTTTLIWMRVSDEKSVQLSGATLPLPPIDTEVQLDMVLTSRADEARRVRFEVRGGVRYWFLGTDIDASFEPPPPLPAFKREFDGDERFADLIIGGRVRVDLSDHVALVAAGDYGGFHISSKSTWAWNAHLVWEIGEKWRLLGGYRMLEVQRDRANVQLMGPIIGAMREF
jgi:hypothetical protein